MHSLQSCNQMYTVVLRLRSLLCLPRLSSPSVLLFVCSSVSLKKMNEIPIPTNTFSFFILTFLPPDCLLLAYTPHPPHHYHICQMKCLFWLDHSPRPLSNCCGKLEVFSHARNVYSREVYIHRTLNLHDCCAYSDTKMRLSADTQWYQPLQFCQ